MFCYKCGSHTEEDASFCPRCGINLVINEMESKPLDARGAYQPPGVSATNQNQTMPVQRYPLQNQPPVHNQQTAHEATPSMAQAIYQPSQPATSLPPKKKKKKIFLLAIIPALVVIIVIVLVSTLKEDPHKYMKDIMLSDFQGTTTIPITEYLDEPEAYIVGVMNARGFELITPTTFGMYYFDKINITYFGDKTQPSNIDVYEPQLLSVYGYTFDTNREGVISMLGKPTREYESDRDHQMCYGSYLYIYLTSRDGYVNRVRFFNP